jgi:DNA repair protein RecN (Recombination protein N)
MPIGIMLRALSIRHFAIIEAQELEFEPGFTAITGETGAGKSILIDALGLLLGNRADTGIIAEGQEAAELSATFELDDQDAEARAWLSEQAMDDGDVLILRRVLPRAGSSRAWINGRSSTIGQLAEIGRFLVEIHGQHEHQELERAEVQRRLLDQQIESEARDAVDRAFRQWREARSALEDFERDAGDPSQLELLRFQVDELNRLQLKDGEFSALESEQERLSRQDEIHQAMAHAARILEGDDTPGVRSLLRDVRNRFSELRQLDPALDQVAAMLDEATINIDEALAGLERMDGGDETDLERLDQVNRRLERALDLARKHRVDGDDLPQLTDQLNTRLSRLENQGEERDALRDRARAAEAAWRSASAALYRLRVAAASGLAKKVNGHLEALGMSQARLEFGVHHDEQTRPGPHGADRIEILFAGNPGQTPKALGRVASGGELSRVSLALMIAARPVDGPRIRIFDEVDAGIGGQTASVVGEFLREVAGSGQAFSVTHLAQVAARADHQIQVSKSSESGAARIRVEPLDQGQRREEIARMLGGKLSEKSRQHAEELLAGPTTRARKA